MPRIADQAKHTLKPRKEWPETGGKHGGHSGRAKQKTLKNKEKTHMDRIGLVGIGFMGMIH